MNQEVNKLIDRLKEIHLHRESLYQEEKEIIKKISEQAVIDAPTAATSTPAGVPAPYGPFKTGDKVYIRNHLGALTPIGRRASLKDRAATVTGVLGDRVYFKTCRGRESWRATHNLRKLTDQEYSLLN